MFPSRAKKGTLHKSTTIQLISNPRPLLTKLAGLCRVPHAGSVPFSATGNMWPVRKRSNPTLHQGGEGFKHRYKPSVPYFRSGRARLDNQTWFIKADRSNTSLRVASLDARSQRKRRWLKWCSNKKQTCGCGSRLQTLISWSFAFLTHHNTSVQGHGDRRCSSSQNSNVTMITFSKLSGTMIVCLKCACPGNCTTPQLL